MATSFYARYIPPTPKSAEIRNGSDGSVRDQQDRAGKRPREEDAESAQHDNAFNKPKKVKTRSRQEATTQTVKQESHSKFSGQSHGSPHNRALQSERRTILSSQDVGSSRKIGLPEVSEKRKRRSEKRRKERDQADVTVELPNDGKNQEVIGTDVGQLEKHKTILSKFGRSSHIAAHKTMKDRKSNENVEGDQEDQREAPIEHGLVPLPQPPEVPDAPIGTKPSALPDWLANPIVVSASHKHSFSDLTLSSSVITSLASKGYQDALAIQSAVLPMLLPGPTSHAGDVCISAATGSGKTLAYVLPMVESLRDKPVTRLRGLIVVPTRELVAQARDTLELCCAGTGLQIGSAVGSRALKEEQDALINQGQRYDPEGYGELQSRTSRDEDIMNWDGEDIEAEDESSTCLVNFTREYTSKIDILICTPGRLVDHQKRTKGFTLEHVQWLVIDEADRLLDQSFQQWVDTVLPALHFEPKGDRREEILKDLFHVRERRYVRKVILSATITRDISKLMSLKLRMPRLVVLENEIEKIPEDSSTNASSGPSLNHQAGIDLPSTLTEAALQIKKVEDKPLYLLEVLSSLSSLPAQAQYTRNASDSGIRASDGSSSDTSSDDESSSSGSSSSSSSVGSPTRSPAPFSKRLAIGKAPASDTSNYGVLVFVNSNENALRLARLLILLRPSWSEHIGTLTKSTATSSGRKTLTAFRKRKLAVLIASDRASRGLDIKDLAQVINYDMPTSLTSYVHRVGRTARAGKAGTATTFVAHHEARWFWNEIGRAESVHRGQGRKVNRIEGTLDSIVDEDREAYEVALGTLGREARGEK